MGFLTYVIYMATSTAMTLWVGRTLNTHGQVLLSGKFSGRETLAHAIGSLLLGGFYFVIFGIILVTISWGNAPRTFEQGIAFLTVRQGIVILVLGVVHFFAVDMLSSHDTQSSAEEKWADGVKS